MSEGYVGGIIESFLICPVLNLSRDTMRVAYIYDAVYPPVKGGVERRIYEIGRRLAKKHEIHWFGLDWGGTPEGITFHPVGRWENLYSRGKRSVGESVYFSLKLLYRFRGEYDLIDCQQFPYLSCFSIKLHSLSKKTPLVVTWHEVWGDYWMEYLGKAGVLGKLVENSMTRLTQNNVSVSRLTQRALALKGAMSALIPNGIDYEGIKGIPHHDEEYDVIFVGRLIPEKNVSLLLDALALLRYEIPDLKAVIIGNGPEKRKLEHYARRLGIHDNVIFKGFLESHEEVIAHMKAAKALVLPSKREGFGIVALEANAAGIPVVTVNYPMNAAKDLVVPGYNGIISEPSPNSLMESILMAMEDGRKMKRNCIKNAKKYDWNRIARMTERFYERVLDER